MYCKIQWQRLFSRIYISNRAFCNCIPVISLIQFKIADKCFILTIVEYFMAKTWICRTIGFLQIHTAVSDIISRFIDLQWCVNEMFSHYLIHYIITYWTETPNEFDEYTRQTQKKMMRIRAGQSVSFFQLKDRQIPFVFLCVSILSLIGKAAINIIIHLCA